MRPLGRALAGIVGSDFSDPTNERLIYLAAAGLVIVGLALLIGTIMWWRRARQEHPVLAPLEVMSTRTWEKAPDGDRRKRLDQVRAGAGTGVVQEEIVHSEPVDLQALVRSVPQAFDDLREPRVEEPVIEEEVVEGEVAEEEVAEEEVAEEEVAEEEVAEEEVAEEEVAEEEVAEEEVAEEEVAEEEVAEEPVVEEDVVDEAEPAAEEVDAEPAVEDEVEAEAVEFASDEPEPEPIDATSVSTERPSEAVSAGPNDSSN